MHSIVTTFRGAGIKVEVANFCAAMDTLIDQGETSPNQILSFCHFISHTLYTLYANRWVSHLPFALRVQGYVVHVEAIT